MRDSPEVLIWLHSTYASRTARESHEGLVRVVVREDRTAHSTAGRRSGSGSASLLKVLYCNTTAQRPPAKKLVNVAVVYGCCGAIGVTWLACRLAGRIIAYDGQAASAPACMYATVLPLGPKWFQRARLGRTCDGHASRRPWSGTRAFGSCVLAPAIGT